MNITTTQKVGWVPEPNGRGTLGLVWSCLATIFLCTWSAIHPDVPPIDEKPMRTLAHRLGRVALAMFAPELMAILAIGELMEARKIRASITGWSLKQAFFLQMGGYQLSYPDKKPFAPTSTDFVGAWSGDMISDPGLKEINIDDRIKADGLVKVITVVQVLWFTMQIVGRVSLRLPLTTIELFTLGIVASGAIMYGCWWNKPFDVRTPIILQATSPTPYRPRSFNNYNSYSDYWWERETVDLSHKDVSFFFSVVTLVFGGIHVLGWNFEFASVAEMWLWRASSIGCTVLPLLLPIMSLGGLDKMIETVSKAFLVIIFILYGIMRLYMFVEMFVALRAAPAGVYQTPQWSQYLPSLG